MNHKLKLSAMVGIILATIASGRAEETGPLMRLTHGWQVQSSAIVKEDGSRLSTGQFRPEGWFPTTVPATALTVLTRNGVYPDLRIGLNAFQIPDASDEFNAQYNLAKYSHLPDRRNPWKDPYWYRTGFNLPVSAEGQRVWLNFGGINYRADIWLNGVQIADHEHVVGSFSRYRFDVTGPAASEGIAWP